MRKWALVGIIVLFVLGGAILFAWLPDRPPPARTAANPTPAPQEPIDPSPPPAPKQHPHAIAPNDLDDDREELNAIRQELWDDMQEDLKDVQKLQEEFQKEGD